MKTLHINLMAALIVVFGGMYGVDLLAQTPQPTPSATAAPSSPTPTVKVQVTTQPLAPTPSATATPASPAKATQSQVGTPPKPTPSATATPVPPSTAVQVQVTTPQPPAPIPSATAAPASPAKVTQTQAAPTPPVDQKATFDVLFLTMSTSHQKEIERLTEAHQKETDRLIAASEKEIERLSKVNQDASEGQKRIHEAEILSLKNSQATALRERESSFDAAKKQMEAEKTAIGQKYAELFTQASGLANEYSALDAKYEALKKMHEDFKESMEGKLSAIRKEREEIQAGVARLREIQAGLRAQLTAMAAIANAFDKKNKEQTAEAKRINDLLIKYKEEETAQLTRLQEVETQLIEIQKNYKENVDKYGRKR